MCKPATVPAPKPDPELQKLTDALAAADELAKHCDALVRGVGQGMAKVKAYHGAYQAGKAALQRYRAARAGVAAPTIAAPTVAAPTVAQQISTAFRDDGQCFRTTAAEVQAAGLGYSADEAIAEGIGIDAICRYNGGFQNWRGSARTGSTYAWEFNDGSAIVVSGDGWDFRAAGCMAHCWEGVGCGCDR